MDVGLLQSLAKHQVIAYPGLLIFKKNSSNEPRTFTHGAVTAQPSVPSLLFLVRVLVAGLGRRLADVFGRCWTTVTPRLLPRLLPQTLHATCGLLSRHSSIRAVGS